MFGATLWSINAVSKCPEPPWGQGAYGTRPRRIYFGLDVSFVFRQRPRGFSFGCLQRRLFIAMVVYELFGFLMIIDFDLDLVYIVS